MIAVPYTEEARRVRNSSLGPGVAMEFTVANCPSQELALTNCLFVSTRSLSLLGGETEVNVELNGVVYTTRASDKVADGSIGMNSIQRRAIGVSQGDKVVAAVYPARETVPLSSATLEVDYVVAAKHRPGTTIDGKELAKSILARYAKQYVTTGQSVATEFQGFNLLLKVRAAHKMAPLQRHRPSRVLPEGTRGPFVRRRSVS